MDLSPFYVAEVQLADYVLRLREPLVLTPELDESKQLMCLVYRSLGIDMCAFTRDGLDEALAVELDVLSRIDYECKIRNKVSGAGLLGGFDRTVPWCRAYSRVSQRVVSLQEGSQPAVVEMLSLLAPPHGVVVQVEIELDV